MLKLPPSRFLAATAILTLSLSAPPLLYSEEPEAALSSTSEAFGFLEYWKQLTGLLAAVFQPPINPLLAPEEPDSDSTFSDSDSEYGLIVDPSG